MSQPSMSETEPYATIEKVADTPKPDAVTTSMEGSSIVLTAATPETPVKAKGPAASKKVSETASTPKVVRTPKIKAEPETPKSPKSAAKRVLKDEKVDATPSPNKKIKTDQMERMPIPQSKEEMGPHDQMMLEWRKDGRTWGEIGIEWKRITGKVVGGSTLPNRFKRVNAAMSSVEDQHLDLMTESVAFVNESIQREHEYAIAHMWTRVADRMKEVKETAVYDPATLEKQFKKIKVRGGVSTPSGKFSNFTPINGSEDSGATPVVLRKDLKPAPIPGEDEGVRSATKPEKQSDIDVEV